MRMRSTAWLCMMALCGWIWGQDGNIEVGNKDAWSENTGWANFRPTHGGVSVFDTHLSGYAWCENIGWVKLGATGSGPYDNASLSTWGVNRSGGELSGYAWSENAGWIRFDPSHGQVTIDDEMGEFAGFAWAENLGWVHFAGTSPEYHVEAVIPTATVSGTAEICEDTSTTVQAALTGYGPWEVHWMDGGAPGPVQSDVVTSPATRSVSPDGTTDYTVSAVHDTYTAGTSSGHAQVVVNPFALSTSPDRVIPQGWDPEVLDAVLECELEPVTVQWEIISGPDAGHFFPANQDPIVLQAPNPVPLETTDYQVTAQDTDTRTTLTETVRVLVAVDPVYFDYVDDDCNNLEDLHALLEFWREGFPGLDDPDGNGQFDVLDYMYINLSDEGVCP